jgi:hypothetical protein
MRIANKSALLGLLVTVSLAANPTKRSVAYSHGTLECLQGNDGPGLRLVLTETKTCEGRPCYPRLEIDVKVQPIPLHRSIVIDSENGAFRCIEPKQSCEQFLSGELVFEHFNAKPRNNKGMSTTDGHYLLRSRRGTERGYFKVDGLGFCG